MVTDDGRVKVLDFGLAKDVRAGKSNDATMTSAGNTRGWNRDGDAGLHVARTDRGPRADHRTDIFSLGVVLHEMATGRRPFQGTSSAELASAILRDTPPSGQRCPPGLPGDLARHHPALPGEGSAGHRFQTAREVTNEIRNLTEGTRSVGSFGRQGDGFRAVRRGDALLRT